MSQLATITIITITIITIMIIMIIIQQTRVIIIMITYLPLPSARLANKQHAK